jgi:hypothetical protein
MFECVLNLYTAVLEYVTRVLLKHMPRVHTPLHSSEIIILVAGLQAPRANVRQAHHRQLKISAFENLKNLDIKTPKLGLFNTRVRKIPSTRVTRTHPDCDSHWIYPGCNTTAAQPLNCFNVYNIPLAEQNNYNRPGGKKLLELAHIYYRDSNIVDPTGCARRPI